MVVEQRILDGKLVQVELLLQRKKVRLGRVEQADPDEFVPAAGIAAAFAKFDLANPLSVLIGVGGDDLAHERFPIRSEVILSPADLVVAPGTPGKPQVGAAMRFRAPRRASAIAVGRAGRCPIFLARPLPGGSARPT